MTQNESIVSDYASEQEERFLERLIFRNRFVVLALFTLVTAFLGYKMTQLRPDASFEKMIPADHPFVVAMKEHRADLEFCAERIVEFTQRRRRILNLVQDALGQLRLDMKYLMFDLDATRRERDQYKKSLDEGGFHD